MIDVICPHCKHVHKEDDSLVNWYWHCQECGELFRWNKFVAAQQSVHWTAYFVLGLGVFTLGMIFGFWLAGI